MKDKEVKIYWAGCNYYINRGLNKDEPIGTATSMHDCMSCENLEKCNLKKTTEIWKLDEIKKE